MKTKFAYLTDHVCFYSLLYAHTAYISSWPLLTSINLIHLVAMQAGYFFHDENSPRLVGMNVST